ncbi:cysteine synthase [Spiribacter salinus M19-40]|jgi:cysteine synthase A|uniref:Cysteine synthase B n=2 Tax=Spiribacter salinus TaxID=1335746 RepID=R4VJB0_9GAMM|nr:cysteine synthase family protein [Spiribacter salinus]MDR9413490.1 cysteine synthase family protein [Spiribacter sp.]AGM40662.1 cysteine synthase [Spiribacter salinus M19-40]MBY5267890.1 pyridoxal-5-phosphate-dependent protein subunit beta [Spiribacter salinus]MDR9454216.1 cysteine synthase family protein [Spiribacter sp.]TQE99314.1 MAG: cysteine synthase family protein [Spiribacter salinus]
MATLALEAFQRQPGEITGSILEAIGNTPLVVVDGIYCKFEFLNPSGSIKARIAHYIISRAEREGLLNPGDTIVEASSGNTGNALAMVAAVKGYRMQVVMPNGMSSARVAISKAHGAEVTLTGNFHVNDALALAEELGQQPGYFCPRQFANEWNIEENRHWLGDEVLRQLPAEARPDALISGVGTGGTLIGLGQALRARNPRCQIIGLEPRESCTIACDEVGHHRIEGISDGFIPDIVRNHRDEVNGLVSVDSDAAITEMRRLARDHGIFAGPSSGAHLLAARRLREENPDMETVITLFCDEGEKYLTEYYAD